MNIACILSIHNMDLHLARLACLIKKSATPRNWSKIIFKIIQNSAFGWREENKKGGKEDIKSWKSVKALTKRAVKKVWSHGSRRLFLPFWETLAFFSPFHQRQECHMYNFFFLFYFLDIRLISHICLISHMPDADRWINNQIKKTEKVLDDWARR